MHCFVKKSNIRVVTIFNSYLQVPKLLVITECDFSLRAWKISITLLQQNTMDFCTFLQGSRWTYLQHCQNDSKSKNFVLSRLILFTLLSYKNNEHAYIYILKRISLHIAVKPIFGNIIIIYISKIISMLI